MCACVQLTFTTLVGVGFRAVDCGKVDDVDDGVPDSPVGGRLCLDFNGVLSQ